MYYSTYKLYGSVQVLSQVKSKTIKRKYCTVYDGISTFMEIKTHRHIEKEKKQDYWDHIEKRQIKLHKKTMWLCV